MPQTSEKLTQFEQSVDRNIERGREDFANGRYREINKQSNAALIAKLAAEIKKRG